MRLRKWKISKAREVVTLLSAVLLSACFVISVPLTAKAGAWRDHAAKLSQLSRQIETLEADIKGLIGQKRNTQDRAQIKALVSQLAQKHAELSQASRDYEVERLHVRFSHPDQNEDLERKYVRYRPKSLSDFEKSSDLDGRLSYLKARVLSTFPIATAEQELAGSPNKPRTPASIKKSEVDEEDIPERIHLSK